MDKARFSRVPATADELSDTAYEMQSPKDQPLPGRKFQPPRTDDWRRVLKYVHPGFWLLVVTIVPTVLLLNENSSFLSEDKWYFIEPGIPCGLEPAWTSWNSLFEVNVRTGEMSFTAAKTMDVVWDLVVGQGGRFLLGWVAYQAYADMLVRIAERHRVSYKLFASLAFSDTFNTVRAIGPTILRTKSWRVRAAMVWILLSIGYVIAFPTLLSASTSYVQAASRAVQLVDDSTAPFDDYAKSISYVYDFHNGSRPWVVNIGWINRIDNDSCKIMPFSNYPGGHGWSGSWVENTITVNGTLYSIANATIDCGFYYGSHLYPVVVYEPGSMEPLAYVPHNQTLCLPTFNKYQWGFSFQILLLVTIANAIWGLGLFVMWLDAGRSELLKVAGRKLGRWRALMDLGGVMEREMGTGTCAYSDKELETIFRSRPGVKYDVTVQNHRDDTAASGEASAPAGHIGLSEKESRPVRLDYETTYGAIGEPPGPNGPYLEL